MTRYAVASILLMEQECARLKVEGGETFITYHLQCVCTFFSSGYSPKGKQDAGVIAQGEKFQMKTFIQKLSDGNWSHCTLGLPFPETDSTFRLKSD